MEYIPACDDQQRFTPPVFKVGREHPVAACLQNGSFPLRFDCSMFKK